MSRPTGRVLALLELLQSGGTRTVAELADRLGVEGRTVRRYVQHLLDLGVPVESVRGRYGGYRISPGYRLPTLMFNDDEALAVLFTGRRAELTQAQRTASETAAAKVRRVLPVELAGRFDALLRSVAYTDRPGALTAPDTAVLLALADAVRHCRRSPSATRTARAGAVNASCTRTASSPTPITGTSPAWMPETTRNAPSGSTASRTRGRCPARSSLPKATIRSNACCRDWPGPNTSTR